MQYYVSLGPPMAPNEIPYEDGRFIQFGEHTIGRDRLSDLTEIDSNTLNDWAKSGIRVMPKGKMRPWSADVARLCAIRDMLALDIPLLHAANIAGKVSHSILYHALRRSASLTHVVKECETGMFRTVSSNLGSDEAILRRAFKEPTGKIAVIKPENLAVKLKKRMLDDGQIMGTVLDLDAAGKRLAERAGCFLAQMVIRLPRRREYEPHDLASMIGLPTLQ
ncbi:hypothetical protein [Mesorhizobium sp. ES1-4]|uniref:hypothetical protein n=1 Tax=Mesorhizobium sp. ES1-4 TaxID=2876627 RepID=UPI001CCEDB9B|nr:hypothetical protein [Mesorhizobium sp. ES1-4]MBZ9797758.1 hypothetical protein [Mesorhizobium sp. ES1-4]